MEQETKESITELQKVMLDQLKNMTPEQIAELEATLAKAKKILPKEHRRIIKRDYSANKMMPTTEEVNELNQKLKSNK